MKKVRSQKFKNKKIPIYIEKGSDGFYVVECPLFHGCYSQGKTLDAALRNIKEAIELALEEKDNADALKNRKVEEVSLHTITV